MLKDILQRLLHPAASHQIAQAPPVKTDLPTFPQLSQALSRNQLPQDNLDGSFTGQPPNTTVFQDGGHWVAPLKPGLSLPPGVARFDAMNSRDRYPNEYYPVLPINPNAAPRLADYLQEIR